MRACELEALAYLRAQKSFRGWVALEDQQRLQQGLRQLYTQGIVERVRASEVLPGYRGSVAYAYRLARRTQKRSEDVAKE